MSSALAITLWGILLRSTLFQAARPEALASSANSTEAAELHRMENERANADGSSMAIRKASEVSLQAGGHFTDGTLAKTEILSAKSRTAPLKQSVVAANTGHRSESSESSKLHVGESSQGSAKDAAHVVANTAGDANERFTTLDHLLEPDGSMWNAVVKSDEALKEVKTSAEKWGKDSSTALEEGLKSVTRAAKEAEESLVEDHSKVGATIREHFTDAMSPL